MKRSIVGMCIGVVLSTFGGRADVLFSENFGNLAEGTAITAGNTSLTYARVGTGAGAYLQARNPGTFSGASAALLSTSSSLTGLGATNGSFTSFEVGTLAFSFRTPESFAAAHDLFALVGTGSTFSGNGLFSGNDLAAGFLVSDGQLRTRNSLNAWEDVGPLLSADTAYDMQIVFNASASLVTYGADSVAGGTADIWLNGSLFGNDVGIRDAVDVSAFRLYATGSASARPYEIDNLRLDNTAMGVPEPSLLSLTILGGLLALCAPDRRRPIPTNS